MATPMRVVGRGPGAADTANIRRKNTSYLYSSRLLPATLAVGRYSYFTTPLGTIGQGFAGALTYTETNMLNANRIPDQQGFIIRKMGFYSTGYVEAGTTNAAAQISTMGLVSNFAYLALVKPEYQFVVGPPFLTPGGAGQYAVASGAAATTDYATNGVPTPQARWELKTPLVLKPGDTFWFDYVVTTASTLSNACKTWMILEGEVFTQIAN